MPTYEYRCPTGHKFEKFYRKISDAGAEVPCPQCGMIAERKLSAGAGLVFKGSGFYITDYGKDGKKDHPAAARTPGGEGASEAPASSGDGPSGGDAKSVSETKSDTKPATAESTPAATKESTKKESTKSDTAPAKPHKPDKPKTE